MDPSQEFEFIDANEFLERCMQQIKNGDSSEILSRMRAIESHKQIGGNNTPLKCNHTSNCTLPGHLLIKLRGAPVPKFICSAHWGKFKIELSEKPWEIFGHPPIVVEYAAWITKDISPRLIRARLKQLSDLA